MQRHVKSLARWLVVTGAVAAYVPAALARADEAPPAAPAAPAPGPLPGHSAHGEAFDEGPRRSAYLMGTTGRVHLPITTKDARAQAFFDQGVGQLHGFWYLEAERSFRQAAAIDPACAMAYWGMAMANVNAAITKAAVTNSMMRLISASLFGEGGARRPHSVSQRNHGSNPREPRVSPE